MSFLLLSTPAFLRLQAQRCRDRGGIIYDDIHAPFGVVADAAEAAAAWLVRRGIGAGDPVALLAGNTPALVAWQFGIWAVGGVVVPVGSRSTAGEAAALLQHSRCRLLVADDRNVELAREVAIQAGVPAGVSPAGALAFKPLVLRRATAVAAHAAREPRPSDLAVIAYTSGTTGKPKGVLLGHDNLLWSALACSTARGDEAGGVALCLSPLTHTPVLVSHLLCRILAGQTAVLAGRFDVDALLDGIVRHGVTDVPLIAGMVFQLIERGAVPEAARRSVARVSVGGAATPMDAKHDLAGLFPAADVIEAYGQTESTDGVAMARHGSVFTRPGTIGRANPYVAVDVLRADGSRAEADESGEIAVSGPTVMRGYLRDAAATAAAVRDGWLRTGDLGHRDADGYLFITGRAKDLIITGGENVSPLEVEAVLRRHPAVADVAVIGTPHPRWGEQITAVIVRAPGALVDADAIRSFAGDHLAGFKKPRRVEFVTALPRNAANKVQTALLREQLSRKA